jgi:hypothetical protein
LRKGGDGGQCVSPSSSSKKKVRLPSGESGDVCGRNLPVSVGDLGGPCSSVSPPVSHAGAHGSFWYCFPVPVSSSDLPALVGLRGLSPKKDGRRGVISSDEATVRIVAFFALYEVSLPSMGDSRVAGRAADLM